MKKIIEDIDKAKGIKRVTTVDERFYARPSNDPNTGLPGYEYVPSVTWIAGCYPKGIAFYKWLADHRWDEAEAIKQAAGDKGSKVHYAITELIKGETLTFESKFLNPSSGIEEPLNNEEWECLMTFRAWFLETKPKVIANEIFIWNDEHKYAGTIDLIAEIEGEKYIIDFKTGQSVWPEYELQLSAYAEAYLQDCRKEAILPMTQCLTKLAILQIGYRRNKNGWKFTEIENKFDLFLAAKQIWANEHSAEKPLQRDYPLQLSLREASVTEKVSLAAKKKKAA